MTAPDSVPLHALAEDNLATASPDLLQHGVGVVPVPSQATFNHALASAQGLLSNARQRRRHTARPAPPDHSPWHLVNW
ncbi:hypothetical protein [Streptomyces sp. NBC_01320]|uniref:hypothetical protein n=1 Tax=Streptomyces sp. NBC_01320 TaxID=2903824 RepID=UPI002E13D116|nr:hypothetical protein OG395_56265 [Streptomyces sp. NBC_01320]